jgi:hypothetical protein
MLTRELLWETADHVKKYFSLDSAPSYTFHNYQRTVQLVQSCSSILENEDSEKKGKIIIILAAWFLYTGALKDVENPEIASSLLAADYFSGKGLEPGLVQTIQEGILSTRIPQQPLSLLEKILCDASNYWMADKDLKLTLDQLREEIARSENIQYSEEEWLIKSVGLLESQNYFTKSARDIFEKRKHKNSALLNAYLVSLKTNPEKATGSPFLSGRKSKNDKSEQKDNYTPERSAESLFRNTSRNQMSMIQLADYKANIIITVNAIIVSALLSILVTKLDTNNYLEIPTLLLVLTSVTTIIIALAASRPKMKLDGQPKGSLGKLEKNMLFFGHFYKKSMNEYKNIIREIIYNKDELYDSLSRDIYFQGILLLTKLRYIIIAYDIFTYGLIISILAYIVSFIMHHPFAS